MPEQLECEFEFVPRRDGVVTGDGQNVRLFRVGLAFGETLSNYLPKS